MKAFCVILCIVSSLFVGYAEDWAVIVAGSNGWTNYRHQADACHAYQIVKKAGISSERIIMMYFDDIAFNSENPFPGQIFNHPTPKTGPGINVYNGCQKDYTGTDVTASNFLNIITGNATAMKGIGSGKVLTSGPADRVFLNFVDHGGSGLLAFPTGSYLYAKPLNDALLYMYQHKMYQQLVFYVEACESGSMFANLLPTNMSIYVTTAANPTESSWGTFCPPQDYVNGKSMGTCLGDTYSINWMQDADRVDRLRRNQSLEVQFKVVRNETTQSHVMQYGDLQWTSESINDFEGQSSSSSSSHSTAAAGGDGLFHRTAAHIPPRFRGLLSPHLRAHIPSHFVVELPSAGDELQLWTDPERDVIRYSAVDSRDISLHLAFYRYLRAEKTSFQSRRALSTELHAALTRRELTDDRMWALTVSLMGSSYKAQSVFEMNPPSSPSAPHLHCLQQSVQVYESRCGRLDDYALQYVRVLSNLCSIKQAEVVDGIQHLCSV